MAHCKKEDLKDVDELIGNIRLITELKEKSFGCFYLKSKGVLHFHRSREQRRFIHLWNGKSWEELDLPEKPSKQLQSNYLKVIRNKLLSAKDST